jgi:poly(A) polymerase Pap1
MNRYGHPWDLEEENKLLNLIKEKKNIEYIADSHKRTTGAIKVRLKYIAVKLFNDNENIDKIKTITNLSEDVILKSIEKFKNKKLQSKENVTLYQNRIIELLEDKLKLEKELNDLKIENYKLKNLVK